MLNIGLSHLGERKTSKDAYRQFKTMHHFATFHHMLTFIRYISQLPGESIDNFKYR